MSPKQPARYTKEEAVRNQRPRGRQGKTLPPSLQPWQSLLRRARPRPEQLTSIPQEDVR